MHYTAVLFIGILIEYASAKFYVEKEVKIDQTGAVSWVGLLRVRFGYPKTEAITGLVLIGKRLAIGNANDVAKIDPVTFRNTSAAMFYRADSIPWYSEVKEYILHPEYQRNILNTIALIKLDHNKTFEWRQARWPLYQQDVESDVYIIGYTDWRKKFEQMTHFMKLVKKNDCVSFYQQEKLDFKTLWPSNYLCYSTKYSFTQCIYDSGMAIATNMTGSWILLGLSTLGPGCALPTRFIEFYPYIPWIREKTGLSTRRADEVKKADQGMFDIVDDLDTWLISRVDDETMSVRVDLVRKTERVNGSCNSTDGVVVYKDFGKFNFEGDNTRGRAVYALSLYDWLIGGYTCVTVHVDALKKSATRFWFNKGFKQDDDIRFYLKRIPVKDLHQTLPPKIISLVDRYENYRHITTTNLIFRFEFEGYATMNVTFFGYLRTSTESDSTTSTSDLSTAETTRRTLSHKTRWRDSIRTVPRGPKNRKMFRNWV